MTGIFTIKKILLVSLPILSLLFGLFLEEDLSTGGSKNDFIFHTLPTVIDFSNFSFITLNKHTAHFPLHYLLLSIPQLIFEDIFAIKLVYFIFSLLFPFLVYINICKLYPDQKFNALIISLSLLYLPFYRASSFWPNAHLTALIFLLAANYCYILSLNSKNFIYKFLLIFFLSLSTYSMQPYALFFIFYLIYYFKNESLSTFIAIFFICIIFSLPAFHIIFNLPIEKHSYLNFTNNISYTIITNFSIILFFLLFFLFNKSNFFKVKNFVLNINKFEVLLFFFLYLILIINYENNFPFGGGFFYKLSNLLFNNNFLFFLTGFLGLILSWLFYKIDKNIFYIIMLTNFMAIGYITSQKYFEPIFLVLILVLCKNFLSKNIIDSKLNSLVFYSINLSYFILASINNSLDLSRF